MKNIILTLSALFIISCSATKFIPPAPSEADAVRAAAMYPGLTLSELNEGKMHFEANCAKCHGLKNPAKYSPEKLKSVVPRMVTKANNKAKKEVVTPAMQESILRYMVAMNGAGKK